MAQTVNLESSGSTMGLYEVEPEGTPRGAILVVQEAFGVNDHIQDICRRFAAEGYVAVAPHLFHRTGDPIIDYEDMQTVMQHIMRCGPTGSRRTSPQRSTISPARASRSPRSVSSASAWGAASRTWRRLAGSSAPPSRSTEAGSPRGVSAFLRWWSSGPVSRPRGSACSATRTRPSGRIRSRRCVPRPRRPRCRPRSSGTPTPTTGSTVTRGPRTTRRRRRMAGGARSSGTAVISRGEALPEPRLGMTAAVTQWYE